ncbi:MAG: type III pantothenate kinase [Bacteroidales bacterium]
MWTGPDVDQKAIQALVDKYRPEAAIVSTVRGSVDGVEAGEAGARSGGSEITGSAHKTDSLANHPSRESGTAKNGEMFEQGNHEAVPCGNDAPKDSSAPSGQSGGSPAPHGQQPAAPTPPPELDFLTQQGLTVLMAGAHLKLPIILLYKTPETLGSDRLASALAATVFFPGENTLVINAGTCLTTDFVTDKGEYIGGSIAPGSQMRLRAMHHFTGKLPLIELNESIPGWPGQARELNQSVAGSPGQAPGLNKTFTGLPGQTTESSMLTGVTTGMIAEIDGLIGIWREKISFFNVILSGGDAIFFDKKLKNRIFAVDNVVLHGLNLMLKHNVQHL